jgi:large subunit ribosomal protein L24
MNIKKGDNVKVIAGKDRGKTGKVLQAFPDAERIVVEGVNLAHRHIRSTRAGQPGQRVEFNAPMNASNVMLVCPKCAKPARVGAKLLVDGDKKRKARVCRKCNEVIE